VETGHVVRYISYIPHWPSLTFYFSRSPGHRVPWWVLIWIKRSPLVFLVLSVACFSVGLVLFAYSSQQAGSFLTEVSHPHLPRAFYALGLYRMHNHNRLYCVQLLRFSRSVHLVCVGALGLLATQRQEVATRFTRRHVGCDDVYPTFPPVC
jgi:hypothetical protein